MAKVKVTGEESPKWKLNSIDGVKILKGLALALTGAVVDVLSEFVFKIDFGEWTPAIYIATPVAVNLVRKLIAGKAE